MTPNRADRTDLQTVTDALADLDARRATLTAERDELIVALRPSMSLRDLAALAGLSHPAVAKIVARAEEER